MHFIYASMSKVFLFLTWVTLFLFNLLFVLSHSISPVEASGSHVLHQDCRSISCVTASLLSALVSLYFMPSSLASFMSLKHCVRAFLFLVLSVWNLLPTQPVLFFLFSYGSYLLLSPHSSPFSSILCTPSHIAFSLSSLI